MGGSYDGMDHVPMWAHGTGTLQSGSVAHSEPNRNIYGHLTGGYHETYGRRRKDPAYPKLVVKKKKKQQRKRRK